MGLTVLNGLIVKFMKWVFIHIFQWIQCSSKHRPDKSGRVIHDTDRLMSCGAFPTLHGSSGVTKRGSAGGFLFRPLQTRACSFLVCQ